MVPAYHWQPAELALTLLVGSFFYCDNVELTLVAVLQELTQKEAEYISLSRDTTETDLKQRREIISGSAIHVDQV
jgi:hypothetical protein